MAWLSILPQQYAVVELWLIRIFLLFALLVIGPWLLIILYDVALYLWRSTTYEIPVVGGRARGRQRPRAPSLAERPDGHRRRISIPGVSPRTSGHDNQSATGTYERHPNGASPRKGPDSKR